MQNNQQGSLQNKFDGFGAAPSELLWNSIAANLDQEEKKRGIIWWWMLGAAASIALLIGVYKMGYNNAATEYSNSITLSKSESNGNSGSESGSMSNGKSESESNNSFIENNALITEQNNNELREENSNETQLVDKGNTGENFRKENKQEKSPNNIVSSREPIGPIDINKTVLVHEISDLTIAVNKLPLPVTSKLNRQSSTPNLLNENLVKIEKPEQKNNWEIGLVLGSSFSRNTQKSYDTPPTYSLTTADMQSESFVQGTQASAQYFSPPQSLLITRPFNLDFTIGKKLGKRWRFQTGLSTSFFKGKNKYNSPNLSTTTANYIGLGIPIHFNVDIIQGKRLSWYAGVGINSELPIFETVKTTYASYPAEVSKQRNFTIGYMGSTQLNTGVRCAINENIDLNVNPYFKYYFAQSVKSSVPLLKRDLWWGASVGLIWKL